MSTVDGSVLDDDEWMRRIEQAEDGAATASAVMALYDSLISHDDAPSRGVGCLMGRQYRLARLASLPSAPARMLADMAAVLVDGAGSKEFDDLAFPVVYALGDNQALPCAAYDSLERAYGGDGGVCPELGVRNPVYANSMARRTILGNPAGCVAYVPERTLQAVREGIVTDRDVLAYLGEGKRKWTLRDYGGKLVWTEDDALNVEMRLSADVRSRVKDALAGGDASHAQHGAVNRGGAPVLVAGSAGSGKRVVDGCVESSDIGSGKTVAARDSVSRLAARPDSVLSLNGRTVEVYNPDGVPLSTVIDGRRVFLVNEGTGERARVPTRTSHVFFVDGDVWFHYPNWGEPDLMFDDGWVKRNMFPKCRCCGAPVDIDGEACAACGDDEWLDW